MESGNVPNAYGKVSSLRITAGMSNEKTYLKELSFTAPFKVMSPFGQPDGTVKVMPLLASAGIMEGDIQEIQIETEPYAKLECVSQSYEKLHKMNTGSARRDTRLKAGHGSALWYRPLPVIPFGHSAFDSHTEISLEDASSSLLYQEIISCGRAASGERFKYRYYHSLMKVRRNGKLIYRENNRFHPDLGCMEKIGFFEGYAYLANILFFHGNAGNYKEEIHRLIDGWDEVCGGVTLTAESDLAVRILSNKVQKLQQLCDVIYELLRG